MARFHISKDGTPGECRASVRGCPLGESTPHGEFANETEARSWAEDYLKSQSGGTFGGLFKKKSKNRLEREMEVERQASADRQVTLESWSSTHLEDIRHALREELHLDNDGYYEEDLKKIAILVGGEDLINGVSLSKDSIHFSDDALDARSIYLDFDTRAEETEDISKVAAVFASKYYGREVSAKEMEQVAIIQNRGFHFDLKKLNP